MKYRLAYTLFSLFCVILFSGCSENSRKAVPHSGNAVYYWRTTWSVSEKERRFVSDHNIQRVYLRLFDVVGQYDAASSTLVPQPRATLHFKEPYNLNCQVVPVVFITDDCLLADSLLAEKVVRRVGRFCETNNLEWNELQIDCDWRSSTREAYFRFLERSKAVLNEMGKATLSATIRLHQFTQPAPPVDYGVLMCYNTGMLTDNTDRNCILSTHDVDIYAKHLKKYALPLCSAYPVFSWKRLFRGGKFVALLQGVDLSDTASFTKEANGVYKVKSALSVATPDRELFGMQLVPGDTVRYDFVAADTLNAVKDILRHQNPLLHNQVIIYSLNENDFTKYSTHEIETIYSVGK